VGNMEDGHKGAEFLEKFRDDSIEFCLFDSTASDDFLARTGNDQENATGLKSPSE